MKASNIVIIKANDFFDIVYDEVGISEDYIDKECVYSQIENEDDGIYKIIVTEILHDKGQEGEYGRWEIAPYYYINKCEVVQLLEVFDHTTKQEKIFMAGERRKANMEKLQAFVAGHSNETTKYEL